MNPTPSLKKFLLPLVLVVIVVVGGLFIWKTKVASNQQASLFNSNVVKTACKINIGPNGLPLPGVPSIKVISPNGGETFTDGQQITVKWSSCNIPASSVATLALHLYDINNNSLGNIGLTNSASLNDGTETITLPTLAYIKQANPGLFQNAVFGKHFKIDLGSGVNGAVQDFSDNLFTINSKLACKPTDPAVVRVDSPNGGELYHPGQQITVKWKTENIPSSETVLIEITKAYKPNDPYGGWTTLIGATPNDGIQTVNLGSNLIAGQYELAIKRNSLLVGDDISDGLFTIISENSIDTNVDNNQTPSQIERTLKKGVKGDDVKTLQNFLGLEADGSYGPKTAAKVMEWQAQNGLTPDGAFGKMSRQKAGLEN